jgi:hypothetical protein
LRPSAAEQGGRQSGFRPDPAGVPRSAPGRIYPALEQLVFAGGQGAFVSVLKQVDQEAARRIEERERKHVFLMPQVPSNPLVGEAAFCRIPELVRLGPTPGDGNGREPAADSVEGPPVCAAGRG